MFKINLLIGAFVIVTGTGCLFNAAISKKNALDDFVKHFERVVFYNEYGEETIRCVRKWKKPIRIFLVGTQSDKYLAVVKKYIVELSELTHLDMHITHDQSKANVFIYFVPWDDMEELAATYLSHPQWAENIIEETSCMFIYRHDENCEIEWATILVSTDESFENNKRCLLEELVHILGLPNDSEVAIPSIFNQWDYLDQLTLTDKCMIRALYDPRIHPGMSTEATLTKVREIFAEKCANFR